MKTWKESFIDNDEKGLMICYDLPQTELGRIEEWYQYKFKTASDGITIISDSIITVKACDEETASHLHNYVYNPVELEIYSDKNSTHSMRVSIDSIDDYFYSIFFLQNNISICYYIRNIIKEYIDTNFFINGEALLNYCVLLGADRNSAGYN